mmetsp:Transcript_130507/g.417634  ORF Transcript_130507/g.417634 Transcript_130507/m.417634 type:complete len:288 (-) Transcript_130507:196-1059(-)
MPSADGLDANRRLIFRLPLLLQGCLVSGGPVGQRQDALRDETQPVDDPRVAASLLGGFRELRMVLEQSLELRCSKCQLALPRGLHLVGRKPDAALRVVAVTHGDDVVVASNVHPPLEHRRVALGGILGRGWGSSLRRRRPRLHPEGRREQAPGQVSARETSLGRDRRLGDGWPLGALRGHGCHVGDVGVGVGGPLPSVGAPGERRCRRRGGGPLEGLEERQHGHPPQGFVQQAGPEPCSHGRGLRLHQSNIQADGIQLCKRSDPAASDAHLALQPQGACRCGCDGTQ